MSHKVEKKWKNEIHGKKEMEADEMNPFRWKPQQKMDQLSRLQKSRARKRK